MGTIQESSKGVNLKASAPIPVLCYERLNNESIAKVRCGLFGVSRRVPGLGSRHWQRVGADRHGFHVDLAQRLLDHGGGPRHWHPPVRHWTSGRSQNLTFKFLAGGVIPHRPFKNNFFMNDALSLVNNYWDVTMVIGIGVMLFLWTRDIIKHGL